MARCPRKTVTRLKRCATQPETGMRRSAESAIPRHEHIARATHSAQSLRLLGIDLDLAAETRNADVDRAVERLPFAVLGKGQDLVSGQDLIGVLDEYLEEIVFHAGDRHFLVFDVEQAV